MITTLLVLSIIGAICMTCLGLAYSNANIFLLEYKDIVLKENALSGIEIAKSNLLVCVKDAIKTSKNKEEFNDYFLGNGSNYFLETIKNISKNDLKNVSVRVLNSNIYEEDGYICFQLISESSEKRFSKIYRVDVIIKNPYLVINQEINDDLENKENIEKVELEKNIKDIQKDEKLENIKQDFDEKSLVILKNYMEM